MSKKKSETEKYPSLKDIRTALAEVDKKRKEEILSKGERELLELSAVALRDAERLAIARLQKDVIAEMEASTAAVKVLAKEIRSKVTRINKAAKSLDKIESVIKVVVRILGGVGKWRCR